MIISKYDIDLRSMELEDLEMVRLWRNADHVRGNMQYQGIISQQEQLKWFEELDMSTNIYLIIVYKEAAVGVCNVKNIDPILGVGEGGIFIGDKRFLKTSVPIRAILAATEFFCDLLRLNTIKISIVAGNTAAIRFNEMLGAKKCGMQNGILSMYFTREMFHVQTAKMRKELDGRYGAIQSQLRVRASNLKEREKLDSWRRNCPQDYLDRMCFNE